MPTYYGTDDIYERAQSLVNTEITALIADMSTNSIVPALLAVYNDHHSAIPMTLPCATIAVNASNHEFFADSGSAIGPLIRHDVEVEIRVVTAYRGTYRDDLKCKRLLVSLLNWLNENRALDTNTRIWGDMSMTCGDVFEDTDTVGGTLTLTVRSQERYTAA